MRDSDATVNLILLTYEQENFVGAAVRSVLAQDCAPCQILISDDCSRDRTFDVIQEEVGSYVGPHQIRVFRNERTLGANHLAECVRRSRGTEVVIFHGDDVALPHRARRSLDALRTTGASLVSTNGFIMTAAGEVLGPLLTDEASAWLSAEEIFRGWSRRTHGACLTVHRRVFDEFPPLELPRTWGATDHLLPFRAALLSGCYFLNEPLVNIRKHERNAGALAQDWTGDATVREETTRASTLAHRAVMLDDLKTLARTLSASGRVRFKEETAIAIFHEMALAWASSRNGLMASGRRSTWISRADAERRVKDAGPRFQPAKDTRRLRRRLMATLGQRLVAIGRRCLQ